MVYPGIIGEGGEGEGGGVSQIIDEKRGAQMYLLPTSNTLKFIQHPPFSSSQASVNLNVSVAHSQSQTDYKLYDSVSPYAYNTLNYIPANYCSLMHTALQFSIVLSSGCR